jgi:hypothetical protein
MGVQPAALGFDSSSAKQGIDEDGGLVDIVDAQSRAVECEEHPAILQDFDAHQLGVFAAMARRHDKLAAVESVPVHEPLRVGHEFVIAGWILVEFPEDPMHDVGHPDRLVREFYKLPGGPWSSETTIS